jgi:integration host factor subunit beta
MNRSDLIEQLQDQAKLSKSDAAKAVRHIFNQIAQTLADGDRVELRGFCSFQVKAYESYTGRNPKTGERITVQQKKLPFFKAGKELKDRADE